MEGLNSFIDNAGCIGRNFTAWLEDPENPRKDDIWDVYGDTGQILYMHGESITVTRIDEQQNLFSMLNRQNTEGYEEFAISFSSLQGILGCGLLRIPKNTTKRE